MNSVAELMKRAKSQSDTVLAFAGLLLLGIMVVPMPSWLLDMLLASSFAIALLVFLTTLSVKKALDLSVFPSLLLVTTLFRLSLNVASTRLILLSGGDGNTGSAGRIIEAFGQVVVGGNFAVGFVVFCILVIINFMVINKGAGRVAEVSARFALDAMPGKQMAIDAELNAGMIDETQAKARRAEVAREANFFGSMDGASKFIKGDAIAGIVITIVNVLGGMFIGVIQHGMPLGEAVQTYTLLTIGDGLVGQIPALIISAAAGLLVTRVPDLQDSRLDDQFSAQLFASPRTFAMLAVALGGFALIPGLRVPFALLGGVVGIVAWQLRANGGAEEASAEEEGSDTPAKPLGPEDMLALEPLAIEIGLDLLYLVDEKKGGTLVESIQRLRNQFAQDLGIVVPSVHLRDDAKLQGGTYVVRLRGEEIGRGKVYPRQHMAMSAGEVKGTLRGIETTDPVYGMPAYWIQAKHVLGARAKGYTVVDVPAVLSTHLSELLQLHAHELYSPQQLARTLERVGELSPKLVEDLIPSVLGRPQVLRVMRNLLQEGVSVRDVESILEALADAAERTKDPEILTEFVRQRLARHITRRIADEEGVVHVLALGADTQRALSECFSGEGGRPSLNLDEVKTARIVQSVKRATESWSGISELVVLTPPLMRGPLRRILSLYLPRVTVVSPMEILPSTRLSTVEQIRLKPTPVAS